MGLLLSRGGSPWGVGHHWGKTTKSLDGKPQGDTTDYFESYTVSTANNVRGSFTATFEGSHGWYWKNKGQSNVVVTLQTEENYQIIVIK